MKNSAFERYKVSLAGLCHYCARLAHLQQMKSDGEVIREEEIQLICSRMERGKEDLLSLKSELGYDDGLQFMEDNLFAGFSVKNGIVTGDLSKVLLIAEPWYVNFPDKGNNYQFEVANYLFAFLQEEQKTGQTVSPSVDRPNLIEKMKNSLKRLFFIKNK